MKGRVVALIIAVMTTAAWCHTMPMSFSIPVPHAAPADDAQARLVFTGDIMLSREVEHEIRTRRGASPWLGMREVFSGADLVMGNLEGSVGDAEDCIGKIPTMCFAVKPEMPDFIRQAGFNALGIENNHSADLGEKGRRQSVAALNHAGIAPIGFDDSPTFFRAGGNIFAVIAVNNVKGADGKRVEIPSNVLRRKMRMARSLANWVIVFVHWGVELADWVEPKQRAMAEWLTEQGADLIIGSHPHVVEAPECIRSKPVFFSLGNHVFDQKYPDSKSGLIADCGTKGGKLSCGGIETVTPPASSFPTPVGKNQSSDALKSCIVPGHSTVAVNGYEIRPRLADHQFVSGDIVLRGSKGNAGFWTLSGRRILSMEAAAFVPPHQLLFTLEQHKSSIDQEMGPRPYVYEVTTHGLVALWRGSALAWPLIDAKILHSVNGADYLCALHRKDSFIMLNPVSTETRTAVYGWNGFGFSGMKNKDLNEKCKNLFS